MKKYILRKISRFLEWLADKADDFSAELKRHL